MKTVLMVAEKPLLAQSIASILSNRQMTSRKGFNGACSVHEYTSSFMGQSAKFKMTSTCGHVMGLDFPGQYNNWDMVDPVDLFNCPVQKKEANSKMKMPQFLSSEGRGCDYLVLWLDCDKEGENICFEVIDCVLPMMRDPKRNDVIHRAKFSAITDRDIKAAMSSLILPNECKSLSVDARQELDLRIGCAFTRFQTRYFQAKYGDLDSSLISFGPCQTPTLGFCVERHDKINSFKPETYWVVQPKLTLPAAVSEAGGEIYPEWPRGRVFDREVAGLFADRCRLCEAGKIVDITQKEGAKTRPQALNTVELMRVASAKLGIGPQQAMHIAEELYTQGYISYPRTETASSYSENFDLRGAVKQLSNNGLHGDYIRDLLSGGMVKPRSGHDAGDHPPITPMRSDPNNSLSGDKGRIFDYIVRHFLASISPDSKFLVTTVRIDIGGEVFVQTGKQMIAPGFVAIVSIGGASDDVILPPFKRGQLLPLESVEIQERKTSPPDYLTEAELSKQRA